VKGIGWKCDQCDKIVIAEGVFTMNGRQLPPAGWWVLYGPMSKNDLVCSELHMCSSLCVSMHQPERLPQCAGVDDFGISDLTAQEFGRKVMARINRMEPLKRAQIGHEIIGKAWSDWSQRIGGAR